MSDIVQIEGTMTAINPLMTKDATTTIVANQITALGAMAPWDVANTYDAADQAEYLGIIYEANAAVSASEAIPTTNAKWFRVLKAYYGGIYDALKAYSTYDSVAFTNSSNVYNIYQANQAIAIGESPETDAAKWDAYKVFGAASGTITEGDDSRVTGAQQTTGKDATGGYAGLTLFKINFKNALDTFTSFFTNANTAARTYTFQDRDGTIADNTDLALKEATANKGIANGYASLDGGGKVPVAQLPSAVMTYEGVWNATTNSPTLVDGTGDAGMVYRVSTAGSQDLGSGSITYDVGDYVIYNGTIWEKSDTTDAVASVAGKTGIVTLVAADITDFDTEVSNNTSVAANTSKWTIAGGNLYRAAGNVGIGIPAPLSLLHLPASTVYTEGIFLGSLGAAGGLWHDNSGLTTTYLESHYDNVGAALKIRMRVSGTPIDALTITGAGAGTFLSTIAASNLSGTNTGDNAANTNAGLVHTTGAESIAGIKTFTSAVRGAHTALTSTAASIAVDFASSNSFTHTFTENTTLANPSNVAVGQSGTIFLTQHASSPKTLAFGSNWKFIGGTVPTVTATNSAKDSLNYVVRSATEIECVIRNDIK